MLHFFELHFIYLFEFWSNIFICLSALNKKNIFRLPYWLGSAIIALLFTILELYVVTPFILFLIQTILWLITFFILFTLPLRETFYLYLFTHIVNSSIQIITIIPFYCIPNIMQHSFVATLGILLTTALSFIFYKFVPANKLYTLIQNSTLPLRIVLVNLFIIIFSFVFYFKLNPNSFLTQYIFVLIVLSTLFFINLDIIYTHIKLLENQKELLAYQQYLPIVEGLIDEVRIRQHNHDNAIQAISALPFSYKDYATLTQAIQEYSNQNFSERLPSSLLKLNYKLVAGFLYCKVKEAKHQGKDLQITIKNYALQTILPEYLFMEFLGILIDNAIEAVTEGDTIFLTLDSTQSKIYVEITNPGPIIDGVLLHNMFQKGYTTKTSNKEQHGLGLFYLKNKLATYNGTVTVFNHTEHGTDYITFKIFV